MMTVKSRTAGTSTPVNSGSGEEWEVRPGGMLVQKRNPAASECSAGMSPPAPTIRVRVKHGSTYHEISISCQATFGELKKLLTLPTGLHHQDQKLFFKDKERGSSSFLDMVGVKDKSKLVLVEDPISQEKRYLEMHKSAKMEKSSKSISDISLEIDRLAGQVSAMESVISKGGKVAETQILTLIELLMNNLLKLDGIAADGDVKLQRKMQVKRVQKYVETLDMLKVKSSMHNNDDSQVQNRTDDNRQVHSNGVLKPNPNESQRQRHPDVYSYERAHREQPKPPGASLPPARHAASGTVVTTDWETFDAVQPSIAAKPTSSSAAKPKSDWELFE
ncbi:hypothetical protein MLD38_019834 [Melastoma candidum]|uniref:Uncharacterized protein n=1 Tax=Melastoma candidum TaxID=119954 RepID=A0ACB9QAU1_9MYRT|nr:hypothetical protein MLD38_019834 [Melastoma candidum]